MRGLLFLTLKHKTIAIVAAVVLSAGGAATFASQDVVFQGPDSGSQVVGEEATATETPVVEEATPTETPVVEEATPTPTPEVDEATPTPTPEVDEATPTPTPEVEATSTPTPEEEGPRDVVGVPDDNPSKQPEDGDGVCEKGETVIKTTPSGKQVNVPCQAVKEHEPKGHKGVVDDDDSDEEEGTE